MSQTETRVSPGTSPDGDLDRDLDGDFDGDTVVVRDRGGRRRFIRTGAAFLLTGASVSAGRPVLAADCDRARGGTEAEDKQATAGSDSDAGANADPAGCGRFKDDAPKISRATPPAEAGPVARVAKVRA